MKYLLACLLCLTTTAFSQDKVTDNVVIVLDNSGSMGERMSDHHTVKMTAAKAALLKVVQQIPTTARIGILVLNGYENWVYPLGPVDIQKLTQCIDPDNPSILPPGGGTPLGARMKEGADALLDLRAKNHYGSYRLLIVTDGEATDGGLMGKYLPDILARGITVDVIGVMMGETHTLATKARSYRSADNPASLEAAIKQVMAEVPNTDKGGSQEDFELAAAIPTEAAAKVINSLVNSGNQPIGEVKPIEVDSKGNVSVDSKGNPVPVSSVSGWTIFWICLGIAGGIIVIIAIIMVIQENSY